MEKIQRRKLTKEEKERLLEKTGGRCAHCGKKLDTNSMTVEHVYPVSKGGDYSEFNLTALCENCNQEKSDSLYHPLDYYTHILKKYKTLYSLKSLSFQLDRRGNEKYRTEIIPYDAVVYRYVSETLQRLYSAKYSRNKAKFSFDSVRLPKVILEEAYPAEASEILEFMEKLSIKHGYKNIYDNDYIIAEIIRTGKVYVLRKPDGAMCGVVVLEDFSNYAGDIPQLNNILELTSFDVKYICTQADVVDSLPFHVIGEVISDIEYNQVEAKIMPLMACRIPLDSNSADAKLEFKIPYTHNGDDVTLVFPNLEGIKEAVKSRYSNWLVLEAIEEKHIDEIADAIVSKSYDEIVEIINNTFKVVEQFMYDFYKE